MSNLKSIRYVLNTDRLESWFEILVCLFVIDAENSYPLIVKIFIEKNHLCWIFRYIYIIQPCIYIYIYALIPFKPICWGKDRLQRPEHRYYEFLECRLLHVRIHGFRIHECQVEDCPSFAYGLTIVNWPLMVTKNA